MTLLSMVKQVLNPENENIQDFFWGGRGGKRSEVLKVGLLPPVFSLKATTHLKT